MDEFTLIERYFSGRSAARGVVLGVGDDAAILECAADQQFVVTTDTVVEGVHFPVNSPAEKLAYRSCAIALSDIAAMGATARWASMSLTVADVDEDWFNALIVGIDKALALDATALIGGDTTRGPLVIGWHIIGTVDSGRAMRRSGAVPGEDIFVSGDLGAAAAALRFLDVEQRNDSAPAALVERYWNPQPRLALGRRIAPFASSCIDVSDGLLADLGHLAAASHCGMRVMLDDIPRHPAIAEVSAFASADPSLAGGDDYELCFTAPKRHSGAIREIGDALNLTITRIGETTTAREVTVLDPAGRAVPITATGFQHFK